MRAVRSPTWSILLASLLALAAGCGETGVRVRLEPPAGATPDVSLRACRPDGTVCTGWLRALDGTRAQARELLVDVTDDTPVMALQLAVAVDQERYCQQVAVTLRHGELAALALAPGACALTWQTRCPGCGELAPCVGDGVAQCSSGCRVAGQCEGRSRCDGCGGTAPLCCPAAQRCLDVDSDGIGSCQ